MGEEITTIDISNAEVLSASSFTNVKNSIDIKIDNLGNLTDANDNAVTMLNFGNRGDHCVTVINAELPSNFSEGYLAYFLVDLKNKTYIQKCLMEGNIAKALITKEISLESQSTECLVALIEADATTGNLREQQEIFVSDVFMGTVRSNFLDSNWMDADISVSEDLTVLDKFETPNPDKYTSMVWVNGETKLNAANMNNIIKGIDELKEQAVAANPIDDATNTLNKIKIGEATYNVGEIVLTKHVPYGKVIEAEPGVSLIDVEFTAEEKTKIENREIDVIRLEVNLISNAYLYFNLRCSSNVDYGYWFGQVYVQDQLVYGLLMREEDNYACYMINTQVIPSLPSDSASKTYTLRSVNGAIDWKDTSVGTQKFENVEVSGTITAGGKSLNAVEANPSDVATTSLNKIKIGNVVYNIVGSSSSGSSGGSDGSAGDSSLVAFELSNISTNGVLNDGVFQELTNIINEHKMPVISTPDGSTLFYSGSAMSGDGTKEGLGFNTTIHVYDSSSHTYASAKLTLMLWSDNSMDEAMSFGSIPTPPDDPSGKKQYILSATAMGPTWIDIDTLMDNKISSAITSNLEADY